MTGNETERLVIRLMELQDIENARLLHNDDSTLHQLSDIEHVSETQQEAWYRSLSTSKTSKRYVAYERQSGDFVGVFRIDALDWKNRNVCVGLDIVADKRGQRYSHEIYDYFFDYLFNQCGMHRLYLVTLDSNTVARNLYKSLGFIEEGRQREAIYRGSGYVDLIMMSLLSHERATA